LEKVGRMREALDALLRAERLSGAGPVVLEQRGRCLQHMKKYQRAAAALKRALTRMPDRFDLRLMRATALWQKGDAREARQELSHATTPQEKLAAARIELLFGDGARARKLGGREIEGLVALRRREYGRAKRLLSDPFLKNTAAGLEFMQTKQKAPKGQARLNLVGLGLDYPNQATLEVIDQIANSDVVINNLSGARAAEFLALFAKKLVTISFEGGGPQHWADKVIDTLKKGKTTTFVTRGHPLVSGHLAMVLLRRAKKRGAETRVFGALSTVDQVLALAEEVLGETFWGMQVYDSRLIANRSVKLETGVPALIYLGTMLGKDPKRALESWTREFCAGMREFYPLKHKLFMHGPRYDLRRLDPLTLGELPRRLSTVDPRVVSSLILLVPAVEDIQPIKESSRKVRGGAFQR